MNCFNDMTATLLLKWYFLFSISCLGIGTLLCYLELHKKRWIRNLPPLYASCNIICYGGPAELRATAKKCPPVAVAIARQQLKGKSYRHSNKVEFNAVEVASSMGWDVVPVKRELRQLQWKQIPGRGGQTFCLPPPRYFMLIIWYIFMGRRYNDPWVMWP